MEKLNYIKTILKEEWSKHLKGIKEVQVCESSAGNEYLYDAVHNKLLGAVSGGWESLKDNFLVSLVEGENGKFWLIHKVPQRTVIGTIKL